MKKVIIFDLGGVILKHRADLIGFILANIFPTTKEEGLRLWTPYKAKLAKGELSSEKFLQLLEAKFNTGQTINQLTKKWRQLYMQNAEIDHAMLDFIDQLSSHSYKIYLLTDTIKVHDDYNKLRGIYDKFERVFKSFEEGKAKAEGKDFFEDVIRKIGVKPQDCIFIDDLEEHINTAESLGIKGILFTNLPQLKKDLQELHVIA